MRNFARNTIAVVINVSKRTDIMMFPVPEARHASRGVRDNLLKDNLPKPNLPNVKDNLPNFVGTICRIPSNFK